MIKLVRRGTATETKIASLRAHQANHIRGSSGGRQIQIASFQGWRDEEDSHKQEGKDGSPLTLDVQFLPERGQMRRERERRC